MPQRYFTDVWYVDEEKATSLKRDFHFQVTGTLEFLPQEVSFRSGHLALHMRHVQSITLTRLQLPWLDYAAGAFIFMLVNLSMEGLSVQARVAFVLAVIAMWILVEWNTKWVLVEYLDEHSQPRRAYFAEASYFGWGGIFGGTKRLYQSLRTRLNDQGLEVVRSATP